MHPRQSPTIDAVARAAGVSKTTVSHVLSRKRPVSQTTRNNVLTVMAEMGFEPNYFAQALSADRSFAIALIVQDLTNPYYPLLGRGLERAVAEAGYVVMLFDGAAQAEATEMAVRVALQRRVDGIVLAATVSEVSAAELRRAGVALAVVGSNPTLAEFDSVSADDERLAADAVGLLLGAGHRRVATIAGPANANPGGRRLRGYREALRAAGVSPELVMVATGDWTREGGEAAMASLLDRSPRPTAVFCANDLMAIGALDAALARGLRAPDDLAIVGVDDIDAAGLVRPSLTTVRIPSLEIGRTAGALLLNRLAHGGGAAVRHVLIQHSLVIRQST
jgi:LacI family transcriptional regulator